MIKNSICSFPETQKREDGGVPLGGLELIGDDFMEVRDRTQQKLEIKEQAHSYGFTEAHGEQQFVSIVPV